jgi:hypothetical protein
VPLARNAMCDESLCCLSGFDPGHDMCDPTHRRCHLKSAICDDCSGLAGSSASRIYGVCGHRARLESCIAAWRPQNHRTHVVALMVDGLY